MDPKRLRFLSYTWVLIASLLLPPIGIVLWWLRPWGQGWLRRTIAIVGRLTVSLALCLLTVVYLIRLNLVHVELSGAGWRPMFSLQGPGDDQTALERHRAAQRLAMPDRAAPAPQPAPEKPLVPTPRTAAPPKNEPPRSPMSVLDAGWTDFRGPNRAAVYTGPILTRWPADGLKPLWRQPIGGGYASFVVANGNAFTIEQRRDQEVVAAYDVSTGRELWTSGWKALFSESMGGDGPRATPVWDDGRLYALGATGEFRCMSADSGKVLWSKNILSESGASNLTWGMAASPLVVDDQVIVVPGGHGRAVMSYNKRTGQLLWGALDDKVAYVSPIVAAIAGERQLVVVTGTRVLGLTVDSGKLLWEYPWSTMNDINCAQPIVVDPNHVFVSSGYDHGSALVEITRNGSGYLTRTVWENRNLKNRFNSSVLRDGFIYGFDEGIFACIDARTGERKWKGGRYGYGQIILAGDHIVVLTESGELALLKAAPESLQELARFPAISGKTWNVPALAGGILLVRNAREMAAFKLTKDTK